MIGFLAVKTDILRPGTYLPRIDGMAPGEHRQVEVVGAPDITVRPGEMTTIDFLIS